MDDKYKIPYINACIRAFKQFHLSVKNAFFTYIGLKAWIFWNDFYGVEHLQSIDDAVDDLIVICKNGGQLI